MEYSGSNMGNLFGSNSGILQTIDIEANHYITKVDIYHDTSSAGIQALGFHITNDTATSTTVETLGINIGSTAVNTESTSFNDSPLLYVSANVTTVGITNMN